MLMLPNPAYATHLGACHHGDALDLLKQLPEASVSLVMTSPPFALRRKKSLWQRRRDGVRRVVLALRC